MDHEVKRLKQSHIRLVTVRWNSKTCPEFTWEGEDQMQKKTCPRVPAYRYNSNMALLQTLDLMVHDLNRFFNEVEFVVDLDFIQRFLSYIGIALLTITGNLDTALDLKNLLSYLMDDLWASEMPVFNLSLTDG
nr:putative reverse transcriptase domain-containing protein [Tanacetum cinerariifolium]